MSERESLKLSAYEAQVLIGTSISGCNMSPDRVFDLQAAWASLYKAGLIDRTDGLAIATPSGGALIKTMLSASLSTEPMAQEGGEWVLVPREPTIEQIDAGDDPQFGNGPDIVAHIYRQMLAVAPPAPKSEPVAYKYRFRSWDAGNYNLHETPPVDAEECIPLYASPAPVQQGGEVAKPFLYAARFVATGEPWLDEDCVSVDADYIADRIEDDQGVLELVALYAHSVAPSEEVTDAMVKWAAREYLDHKGENPDLVLNSGHYHWELCAPAMRAALLAALQTRSKQP